MGLCGRKKFALGFAGRRLPDLGQGRGDIPGGQAGQQSVGYGFRFRFVHFAHNHDQCVFRDIVMLVKLLQIFTGELFDGVYIAFLGVGVGMATVQRLEEGDAGQIAGGFLALLQSD
nr:hypothetical protein [uncultured Thiodictyon sp.]